jgi:hypothetical protein
MTHWSPKPRRGSTSLRHFDSRASVPRAPKDLDTSALEPRRSTPREPRELCRWSLGTTNPEGLPTPRLHRLDPQCPREPRAPRPRESRRRKLRRATRASNSMNLRCFNPGPSTSPNPSPSGTRTPRGTPAFRSRDRRCRTTWSHPHLRLGEPQRIRFPKNAWHVARNEDHRSPAFSAPAPGPLAPPLPKEHRLRPPGTSNPSSQELAASRSLDAPPPKARDARFRRSLPP